MMDTVFDAFVRKSPVTVMARGMMGRAFNPEQLDEWFENTAEFQYTRDLLFSSIFGIMTQVVCGYHKSVHAAFQDSKKNIGLLSVHGWSLYLLSHSRLFDDLPKTRTQGKPCVGPSI